MRKNLTYKILAAVMAVSAVNVFMPHNMLAYGITSDNTTISTGTINENIYGNGHSFTINGDAVINGNVYGAINENSTDDVSGGNVTISGNATINGNAEVTYAVYGGYSVGGEVYNNTVNISGGSVGAVFGGYSGSGEVHHNTVNISGDTVTGNVHGGWSNIGEAYDNTVNISNGSVEGDVYGGNSYSYGQSISCEAYDNTVNISGAIVTGKVYGGYSDGGNAYDNEVVISGSAVIENANLYGSNISNNTGNTLTINGWSGKTNSVQNFNDIAFKNINWQNGNNVLTITTGSAADLDKTTIDTIHIAGGSNINVGESMMLIKSENNTNLGLTEGNVTDTFTAGVAREGLGSTRIDGNVVTFNVNSIKLSSQAVGAAQTRAASAAFVNQGTDLISDILDTISRDDNYGVKTFAAVHGNRSKYDVADDIKINGWSTIVGVGNADKFDNGSEFSWGVFYEL